MNIAFFTEMGFVGKVHRNHENMRVEFAWMASLEATHYPLGTIPTEKYDLALVLNSKTKPELLNVEQIKTVCEKVAILQEGPHWYFQDYILPNQIHYFNNLMSSDIIYVHNITDKLYYQGLTNHPDIRVIPSLMIEDAVGNLERVERKGVIIGGNFVSWYGGFDSYIVAQEFKEEISCPSMGRKQAGEEQLLNQLPYMNWRNWIHALNRFKYAVHLMRTYAAGTFALNCAYLGIPCIGYEDLDTQRILHPNLTVKAGDLVNAKELARRLSSDREFYEKNSKLTSELYYSEYHESVWKSKIKL